MQAEPPQQQSDQADMQRMGNRKRTRAGEKLDRVIAFLKKTTEECEDEKARLQRRKAQRGSSVPHLSAVGASEASGSRAAHAQWDARQAGGIKLQQSWSYDGVMGGVCGCESVCDGDQGPLSDTTCDSLSTTILFDEGEGFGLSFRPRGDPQLAVEQWEFLKYVQEEVNRDCMWLEATDENLPAQGVWEQVRVGLIWGSFTYRYPGHWSHRDVLECLASMLPANAVLSLAHSSGNLYVSCLMDFQLQELEPDLLALIWSEDDPIFWGGGRGQQDEQVGKAINHIRRFQIGVLAPPHMRILLQAKPQLADKVLRMEEAQPVTKLLKRAASQAKLPLAGPDREEQRKAHSASPERPAGGRGTGSGGAMRLAGGKGSGAASPVRRNTQQMPISSKGKGAATPKDIDPPVLFEDDWNVPIIDNLLPAHQAGITLAVNMQEAGKIAERMKDSKGQVAMVTLDKLPGTSVKQEQVCVNLGVKHAGACRVQSSNVWLVQLGAQQVELQNLVPTVEIKPSTTASRITAITIDKKQAASTMVKKLTDRSTEELKTYLAEEAGKEHAGAMDIFKLKDEGAQFYGLMRYPQAAELKLLKMSGSKGVFVRTPKEDLDKYGITWLPGDTGKSIEMAQEALKQHTAHLGLIAGKGGYGIRAAKDDTIRIKEAQGLDASPAYCLKGLPPALTADELQQLVRSIGWDVVLEEGGRRMARGGATGPKTPPRSCRSP